MKGDLANALEQQALETDLSITCPECSHGFHVKLRVLLSGSVQCPSCSVDIPVDTREYEQGMKKIKQATRSLENSLKKSGVKKITLKL